MINLHEKMLPTSAGIEPATSWSPVGRRIQLSHQGRLKINDVQNLGYQSKMHKHSDNFTREWLFNANLDWLSLTDIWISIKMIYILQNPIL